MAPVIIAKDLYKCYPGFPPVLRDVNISVEPGEMAAIMGPSGCGKSTMLHVLGMLHAPDSGSLEILGTDVLRMNAAQTAAFRRGNMGFVMQASNLFEHSTVFENVEFPLIYENVPPQERWERVIRALDLVHLSARVHYRGNRLSGGEQQRVAIARAMVNNPRILLADEPTGALDARTSRLIMENFRRLCHSGGVSMIMVTHDPAMAEYCDSIYTLDDGILHCRKRDKPELKYGGNINFLKPPEPLARGALVAVTFPDPRKPDLQILAARMNSIGLLSRIYALFRGSIFGGPQGYALPLPIAAMSFRRRLMAMGAFFHQARGSESLWSLWRKLPPHGSGKGSRLWRRIRDFACGAELARWGIADNIQFLYAAEAEDASTAAWVAAHLLRQPFAFALRAANIPNFGGDWRAKARDALFVSCTTQAVLNAARELLPELAPEKFVLLRDPPVEQPAEEELDSRKPTSPGLPVTILIPGPELSQAAFRKALGAAAILKRLNVKFRLGILGKKTLSRRWRLWRAGLGSLREFIPWPVANMGEVFRAADIMVVAPPDYPGGELALPLFAREAMAFGVPIVAMSLSPGLSEALKPDHNCLLLGKDNPEELAQTLSRLIGDLPRRIELGRRARADIRALLAPEAANRVLSDLIVARVAREEASQTVNADTGDKK